MNEYLLTSVGWSEILIDDLCELSVELLHLPGVFSLFLDTTSKIFEDPIVPVPVS